MEAAFPTEVIVPFTHGRQVGMSTHSYDQWLDYWDQSISYPSGPRLPPSMFVDNTSIADAE